MDERPLRPLVEAALANELRLLEAGIRRTEQRLTEFEARSDFSTVETLVHLPEAVMLIARGVSWNTVHVWECVSVPRRMRLEQQLSR